MSYIFFLVAGVSAFMASYYLNTSTRIKHVSISEVSESIKGNRKYAEELERFNQRQTGEARVASAREQYPVDSYLEDLVEGKDIHPHLYMHLAKVEPTAEMYQGQVAQIGELARANPGKTISDCRDLLTTLMENDKVTEYGLTMVQMSQVPELQKEVAELARKDLKELTVKEIKVEEALTIEDENKRRSDDKYVQSIDMMYHAFLNTQMAAEQNPLNETIDIIARNDHSDLRRTIASNYVKAYPRSYDDLMQGLESEKIKLTDVPRIDIPTNPPENQNE